MDGEHPQNKSRALTGLLVVMLLMGCVLFAWRGPIRALSAGGNYDFLLVYSASRAWLHGENPYEREAVTRAWMTSGGPEARDPMFPRGTRDSSTLVYPPSALVILSPLAALPWNVASPIWAILNTMLAAGSLLALARVAALKGNAKLSFLAVGVWMFPAMTCTGLGQTALVVVGCVCGAAVWPKGAGVLLGIGGALKPQLGLLFTVYEAGRLRWKRALISLAVVVILSGIGAARMQAANIDWYGTWQRNLIAFTTVDDGDPTRQNAGLRYQVINLHYPLHNFTDNRQAVRLAVYLIAAALCGSFFWADIKRGRDKGDPGELLARAMVAAITLIVAYHRYYDAAILIIPLALAIRGISLGQQRHWITLALVLGFIAPYPVIAMEAANRGWAPSWIAHSTIGQNLILPCQAWGLVALAAWIAWLRRCELTQKST